MKKLNGQPAAPTHRGTHHVPQSIPDTPDGVHNTQALPRRGSWVPKGRSAGLPTADRLTRHQECPSGANLALSYEHATASKTISNTARFAFGGYRRTVAHTQTQRASNAPPMRKPQARTTTPDIQQSVRSPPTAAMEWPLGIFEYV